MKKLLLICHLVLSMFALNAEEDDKYVYYNLNSGTGFSEVNLYQNNTTESIQENIPLEISKGIRTAPGNFLDALVEYLISWTDDDFLKIKSIHDWICTNIAYDVTAYNRGEIKLTEPLVTLRYGTAVCGGYAMLFNQMAKKAGFESHYVAGVTKGRSKYAIGPQGIFTRHAWNSVKINERYYLVDVTWDAGYVNNNKFIYSYSTDFFLTEPDIFVKRHYPNAPGWLLIDEFITIEKFKTLN